MRLPPLEQAPKRLSFRTMEYLRMLAATVDAKGNYFPGHSDAVAYIVTLYASELGITEPLLGMLQGAAMLHDTGKIRVPDSVLLAPRPLTEDEWIVMRSHSVWSAEIAAGIDGIGEIPAWIRHHHEHWDGSGYPDGLKGEEIPWQSRLMLVADAFHVMTSMRPYRSAMSRQGAFAILADNAGGQFDPFFVGEALAHSVRRFLPPR